MHLTIIIWIFHVFFSLSVMKLFTSSNTKGRNLGMRGTTHNCLNRVSSFLFSLFTLLRAQKRKRKKKSGQKNTRKRKAGRVTSEVDPRTPFPSLFEMEDTATQRPKLKWLPLEANPEVSFFLLLVNHNPVITSLSLALKGFKQGKIKKCYTLYSK